MKPNQKDWLQLPVEHWTKMKDYNYVKKVVEFLEVVNDCAERGVKLIQDFKNKVKDPKQLQYVLHIVENHRKRVPLIGKKENLNNI